MRSVLVSVKYRYCWVASGLQGANHVYRRIRLDHGPKFYIAAPGRLQAKGLQGLVEVGGAFGVAGEQGEQVGVEGHAQLPKPLTQRPRQRKPWR